MPGALWWGLPAAILNAMRTHLGLALLLLAAGPTRADEVLLKNGASYPGAVLEETSRSVTVQSLGVAWTFPRARVASVKRGADVRAQELARTAAARVNEAGELPAPNVAPASRVVLYGTPWCGWCTKARSYLKSRGIAFEDRDVESDPEAASDLAALRRRVGLRSGGVPVIDVGGTVIVGFDRPRLDAALQANGLEQR